MKDREGKTGRWEGWSEHKNSAVLVDNQPVHLHSRTEETTKGVRKEISRTAFVPVGTHQVSMRGHASSGATRCSVRGGADGSFSLFPLAKIPEFQKINSSLRDKRSTGLTSLMRNVVWVQALMFSRCSLISEEQSPVWLNSPWQSFHYNEAFLLSTQVLANVHTPCVCGPWRPSSDAPSSYGFTEVLDHYETEFSLCPLLSICRIFHTDASPKTQAWPGNHWW